MAGTFPTTVQPESIEISSIEQNFVDRTQGGKRQTRNEPGHVWQIKLNMPAMTEDDYRSLYAFKIKQKGIYDTFQIVPYTTETPRGSFGGTPVVNGANQSGNTLAIDGASVSTTSWARAGDVFKLAGHPKVYMITEDANTDATGAVTLTFEPDLHYTPTDNEALTVSSVPFTVAFSANTLIYTDTASGIYPPHTIELVEVY